MMDTLESRTLFSVPAIPASLKATVASTAVHLQWQDKSSNETGFEIYRGTSKTSMTHINTVGTNKTSYDTTVPKLNTTYWYAVKSHNGSGASALTPAVSVNIAGTATTSGSSTSNSNNSNVIYIGPSRSVKTLSDVKWPAKGGSIRLVFDYSSSGYTVTQRSVSGNVIMESADPHKKATLKLPASFKSSKSSNSYIAGDGAFKVSGNFTIRNFNVTGGDNAILLGSTTTANIVCENIHTDGGAIWKGDGISSGVFRNNEIVGNPRGNVYANYNHVAKSVLIDHSGTNVPIPQGGRLVNGNPIGESPIRIMSVNSLTIVGVKTKPWFYKPGKIWKQDIQIRPTSGTVKLINCTFYQPDVGDMTWRHPALSIQYVEFNNCTLTKSPNLTGGAKVVKLVNCMVGGNRVTRTY